MNNYIKMKLHLLRNTPVDFKRIVETLPIAIYLIVFLSLLGANDYWTIVAATSLITVFLSKSLDPEFQKGVPRRVVIVLLKFFDSEGFTHLTTEFYQKESGTLVAATN